MKRIVAYAGAFFLLALGCWIALVLVNPSLPGEAPGTVKAGYERFYDMGQRIESSGMVFSVQSVSEDAELARQAGVPEGSTILLVDVAVENVRAWEGLFFSPFFAVLYNAREPGRYAAELVSAGGRDLRSGQLAPGEVVRGTIAFRVPAGERPSYFKYGEGMYTNTTGFPNWAPIHVRLK